MIGNRKIHKFFIRVWVIHTIVACISLSDRPVFAQEISPAASFYKYYYSLDNQDNVNRISDIQNFITNHPENEEAYIILLDTYIFCGLLPEARKYFKTLTHFPEHQPYASWALARCFLEIGESDSVCAAFQEALQYQPLPIRLLIKTAEFTIVYEPDCALLQQLLSSQLSPDEKRLLTGISHFYEADYRTALVTLEQLSEILKNDPRIIDMRAYANQETGNLERAVLLRKEGLQRAEAQGQWRDYGKFLCDLADYEVYAKRNYRQASDYLDSARVISERTGNFERLHKAAGYLGSLKQNRGDFNAADTLLRLAGQTAMKFGQNGWEAEWRRLYGMNRFQMGDYNMAIEALERSSVLAESVDDAPAQVNTKLDIAGIYIDLKLERLAHFTLEEAREIAIKYDMPDKYRYATAKLGEVAMLEGKYSQARDYFRAMLDYQDNKNTQYAERDWWLGRLGQAYLLEGHYLEAADAYRSAYLIAAVNHDSTYIAWYSEKLAEAETGAGLIDSALVHFQLAEIIAKTQKKNDILWETYAGMSKAYKAHDKLEQSIVYDRRAVKLIEETHGKIKTDRLRIGYFVEGYPVYHSLVNSYYELYRESEDTVYLDSLMYFYETSRGKALSGMLSYPQRQIQDNAAYRQAVKKVELLHRRIRASVEAHQPEELIQALWNELTIARLTLAAQRLRLVETNRTVRKPLAPPSMAELRNYARENGAGLLLYHINDNGSLIICVTGDAVAVVLLSINADSLAQQVKTLMQPFHNVSANNVSTVAFRSQLAHALYRELFEKVQATVDLPKILIVLPDGPLAELPFDLLLSQQTPRESYTPTDLPEYAAYFLVHDYAFSYIPSISSLFREKPETTQSEKMAIFANPTYIPVGQVARHQQAFSRVPGGWSFASLPGAVSEAQSIGAVLPETTLFVHQKATETSLRRALQENALVHLSTHGLVDTTFEAFSGLVLASAADTSEDGLLMGYELENLIVNSQLLVLSACETGRGKRIAGEGVLGLPRYFLGTGAQSVLMSLWKIEENASSDMIPLFYKGFVGEQNTLSLALQWAKLQVIDKIDASEIEYHSQHPFFWAVFNLYGNSTALFNIAENAQRVFSWKWIVAFIVSLCVFIVFMKWLRRKHQLS